MYRSLMIFIDDPPLFHMVIFWFPLTTSWHVLAKIYVSKLDAAAEGETTKFDVSLDLPRIRI